MTKCEYDFILQGKFTYGWEDLEYCKNKKESKQKLKQYRKEGVPCRIIMRKQSL